MFIGQGADDKAVTAASADARYAGLRAIGRDVTYARVPGDHGFMVAGPNGTLDPAGWRAMHDRVIAWFLAP